MNAVRVESIQFYKNFNVIYFIKFYNYFIFHVIERGVGCSTSPTEPWPSTPTPTPNPKTPDPNPNRSHRCQLLWEVAPPIIPSQPSLVRVTIVPPAAAAAAAAAVRELEFSDAVFQRAERGGVEVSVDARFEAGSTTGRRGSHSLLCHATTARHQMHWTTLPAPL